MAIYASQIIIAHTPSLSVDNLKDRENKKAMRLPGECLVKNTPNSK